MPTAFSERGNKVGTGRPPACLRKEERCGWRCGQRSQGPHTEGLAGPWDDPGFSSEVCCERVLSQGVTPRDLTIFRKLFNVYLHFRKRERERKTESVCEWQSGREREGDTESEAGSRLSAQNLRRGSNPQTVRS